MTFKPSIETDNFLEKQELYLVSFQNSDPKHFDMIPEILDYLTYLDTDVDKTTGEITYYRKSLTSDDINLYRIIKQKAGSINKSWAKGKDYARQMKCNENTITKYKRILQMPFEQLEGNSLIHVDTIYTLREREGAQYPEERHIISGIHIWNYNNAFMATCDRNDFPEKSVQISKEEYELSYEKMRQKSIKEEIIDKIVDKSMANPQKQDYGGGLIQKKRITPQGANLEKQDVNKLQPSDYSVNTNYAANAGIVGFSADLGDVVNQLQIETWLNSLGYDHATVCYFTKEYTIENILLAKRYLCQEAQKTFIDNALGYFRRILENQWYRQLHG